MSIFSKPEVVFLKETSDSKIYLEQLENLQKEIPAGSALASKIEKEIAIIRAGILGEEAIIFELKNSGMDLVVLHDIYMETSDGRGAQIDFIVLTPYVNVFLECKNLFGDIEITNKGDFIRTFSYGGKKVREGIYSPITQNERHLAIYKEIRLSEAGMVKRAGINLYFEEFNRSFVVLANPKTVVNDRYAPKSIKDKVIRCDQLVSALKNIRSSDKSSFKSMLQSGERLLERNIDSRKDYIQKFIDLKEEASIQEQTAQTIQDEDPIQTLICPRCGKELVLRKARKGQSAGSQFYGCSGFPKCRYTRQLPV